MVDACGDAHALDAWRRLSDKGYSKRLTHANILRKRDFYPRNSVPAPEQAVKVLPPPSQRMENRVITLTSGGALLSQQFASVWDKFLTEVESVDGEVDHISFLVLAKGLEALAAQVEPLNRAFFSQFTIGCPYLVRIMMAVWNLLEGHFQ